MRDDGEEDHQGEEEDESCGQDEPHVPPGHVSQLPLLPGAAERGATVAGELGPSAGHAPRARSAVKPSAAPERGLDHSL